mmetsp:Transcript_43894/g.92360  ORF Transcript_43894/g.92360 Transcript_43894/m.92360 type:complete len:313 (+) Transcript_43894:437-1375(+)
MHRRTQCILNHVIRTQREPRTARRLRFHTLLAFLSQNPSLRLQSNGRQFLQLWQIRLPTLPYHLGNQFDQLFAPSLHGSQHLLMIGMSRISIGTVKIYHLIGNQTHTQHGHTRMMRRQYFRYRRHSHGVRPKQIQHGTFTLTFVLRTTHKRVRSIAMQIFVKIQFFGNPHHNLLQFHIVKIGRGRKPRSHFVIVRSHQRILPRQQRQRNVIADHGHVPHGVFGLQSSRRVGHQYESHAQTSHDLYGKNDRRHIVSFVTVKSSAEAYGRYGVQCPNDQFTRVSCYGSVGKSGDGGIGNGDFRRGWIEGLGEVG